jgi:hypothetical protein
VARSGAVAGLSEPGPPVLDSGLASSADYPFNGTNR